MRVSTKAYPLDPASKKQQAPTTTTPSKTHGLKPALRNTIRTSNSSQETPPDETLVSVSRQPWLLSSPGRASPASLAVVVRSAGRRYHHSTALMEWRRRH